MDEEKNITEEHEQTDTEFIPDEEAAVPDAGRKIKKLKDDLSRSEKERLEYLDGWQRAKADLINYKKDEGKRFEEMAHFVSVGMMQELLPVLDSFDMAMAHAMAPETERGVLLIRAQLMDALKKRGMEEITATAGEAFDPARHESIGEIESDYPAGTVAETAQKGYAIADRIIRPTRVRLAKGRRDD